MLAIWDVSSRYVDAWQTAWSRRREMDAVKRTADELAFQPAVIELIDTPASPAPRRSMQAVTALFLVSLLWASVGKLDIVAVARGKIVSDSRTKTVQALETSLVRRVAVTDGQHVNQGDLLMELDAVGVRSDKSRANSALTAARLNAERNAALAVAYESETPPVLPFVSGASEAEARDALRLAATEYQLYRRKVDSLRAAIAQKQAERETVERSISPATDYANISSERVEDYKRLLEHNYVSRQEYLMREQERINAERDLQAQKSRLKEILEAVQVADHELASTMSSARRDALDQERQAREQVTDMVSELAKASDRDSSMRLISPVEGTIQQLSVHTVGGVVTPALPLMSVVPNDELLEVEATVLNQDIGFVQEGQDVVAKLETFPYARYGSINGHVLSVSRDAVLDEKLGLIFPVRIALDRSYIAVDGRHAKLSSGMALSVEIKTGKRSVLSYFLDPLTTELSEALRER